MAKVLTKAGRKVLTKAGRKEELDEGRGSGAHPPLQPPNTVDNTMLSPPVHLSKPPFVHRLVWYQAQVNPDAVALLDAHGNSLSYADLTQRSRNLAVKLQALGVGVDDRVAVWMDRSPGLVVALLAILEAGAAYAPIDPITPDERVAQLIANLDAAVLITDRSVVSDILGKDRILLHPDVREDSSGTVAFREPDLCPDHLAYVIHTSGSTGTPKGVAMSHRGLSRLINWQVHSGPPGLRTLMFTSVSFDVTFQEVFSTLCTGGTLVLSDNKVRRDPDRLVAFLDDLGIERLFLPYVALQQLALSVQRTGRVPRHLAHVLTAGERLSVTEAIAELFRALPKTRLDNHYGPTETHLVTSWTLEGEPGAWPLLPPIGTAIDGVRTYILDRDLQPVPLGEAGELYVGGVGVARGYLKAPQLTAERFLPDPFSDIPGSRMYMTGDVVRQGFNGVIDFLGRSDDQLKVRGFRVEPAEVELALTEYPDVQQAAVVLQTIAAGVSTLVAYVVADDRQISNTELSEHLRCRLPEYMVPSRFVQLDALPLTPSGKVDRKRLTEVELPALPSPVMTEGESLVDRVRAIWIRVLGHDEFDLDDDFFDVGGDSILATWVVTELSQALRREVELSLFLDAGTVEGIAQALEALDVQTTGNAQRSELVTLEAGPSNRTFVFVHPLGGELLAYRALARSIRSRLRVLGLRLRLASETDPPTISLPEIAAVHVEQLVLIQPTGPYLLAGWSFGGVLAYEIAQQLRQRGEQVAFLGLIDTNPILDPITGLPISDSSLLDELTGVLAAIDEAGHDAQAEDLLSANPGVRSLLGNAIPEGVTVNHLRKYLRMTRVGIYAAMHYHPSPYDGSIDLFQPDGSEPKLREALLAKLHQLAHGPLQVHTITGDHYSILREPLVERTAAALDNALEVALQRDTAFGREA